MRIRLISFLPLIAWSTAMVAEGEIPPVQFLTPVIELKGPVGSTIEQYVTVVSNGPTAADVTVKLFVDATNISADFTFPATVKLTPSIPQRVKISLTHARAPITAMARLDVYLDGKVAATSPLLVEVFARPTLTVLPTPASFKFTDVRGNWFSRWIARNLLSAKEANPVATVQIREGGTGSVENVEAEFSAVGSNQGVVVTNADYTVVPQVENETRAKHAVLLLPVKLNLAGLPPDSYTGAVYFTAKNLATRAVAPVNFSVRADPLLPAVLLFFGVLIGRFLRYMDGDGSRQHAILDRLERVERHLSPQDMSVLTRVIAAAKRAAYDRRWSQAETLVSKVEGRSDVLVELDVLDDDLNAIVPTEKAILDQAEAARKALQRDDDASAAFLVQQIKIALRNLPGVRGMAQKAIERSLVTFQSLQVAPKTQLRVRAADGFARIVGFSPLAAKAEFSRRIARPLLYVFLVITLVYLGLRTLYLANDTFGAGRMADYIGLLMWAISADVASKTLSNIRRVP
ncbi:MAG TPA: hypothetical protein VNA69_06660 [Thermoanaerobaculia bacterium]|nr:hypothetical protein [Thermoanaerobaculia bacterium]